MNHKYTLKAVRKVCRRIANGESVRSICAEPRAKGIPPWRSFYRWVNIHPEAQRIYEAARLMRCELLEMEIMEIADGREEPRRSVAEDRLRVAARRWRLEGFRTAAERRNQRRGAQMGSHYDGWVDRWLLEELGACALDPGRGDRDLF